MRSLLVVSNGPMKRVIVQILPAEDSSAVVPVNGNGVRPSEPDVDSKDSDPGVRVEAVVSPQRARVVVDTVLNTENPHATDTPDRIIDLLVQRELARDDSGQVFHRLISSVEKALLEKAFAECDHIQTRTADRLGVNRNTIHKKLVKHELIQPDELAVDPLESPPEAQAKSA